MKEKGDVEEEKEGAAPCVTATDKVGEDQEEASGKEEEESPATPVSTKTAVNSAANVISCRNVNVRVQLNKDIQTLLLLQNMSPGDGT